MVMKMLKCKQENLMSYFGILCRSHIRQYSCGYCKLGYNAATICTVDPDTVAEGYPQPLTLLQIATVVQSHTRPAQLAVQEESG